MRRIIELQNNDVAAASRPNRIRGILADDILEDGRDRGAGHVYECAAPYFLVLPVHASQHHTPTIALAPRGGAFRSRAGLQAAPRGIDRIQHHVTRIVDPTIVLGKALNKLVLKNSFEFRRTEIDRRGRRHTARAAEPIVDPKPQF